MQDYVKRMVEEYSELNDKIEKLTGFLFGNIFNELNDEKKRLLIEQRAFMMSYASTLRKRIDIEVNQ